jgi:hypothetical protein
MNLFVASADGSGTLQLTKFTGSQSASPIAVDPNVVPQWGPNNEIAFAGETIAKNGTASWNIWLANAGSGTLTKVPGTPSPIATQAPVEWTPDGKLSFNAGTACTLWLINPDGSGLTQVPIAAQPSCTSGSLSVPVAVYRQQSTGMNLAASFMPIINFDMSEKWRPMNVDAFLNETDPVTGQPWNQVCSPEQGCQGLNGASSLLSYATTDSYISIHRDSASDPDSYVSPNPNCLQPNQFGTTLHDCGTGSASAIYYHIVGPSPGGYEYIDYWIFYRYNQGWQDVGNHAGDWEGVTIAPTSRDNALAFVELSHHGAWDAYLPGGLDCAPGGTPGTCSTSSHQVPGGNNVDVFPAAGSHANYPQPNSSDPDDGPNDGNAPWGNNLDSGALIQLPAPAGEGSPWAGSWTDWPGAWGDTPETGLLTTTGSPCGPAAPLSAAVNDCGDDHAGHYYAPWSQTGGNLNCSGMACPQLEPSRPETGPLACSSWFGGGVVLAGCNQTLMRRAVLKRGLSSVGQFTITQVTPHRTAATAPGLAQMTGTPLRPGSTAIVSGALPQGTQLFVRAIRARKLVSVIFELFTPIHGHALIHVARGAHGWPSITLKIRRALVKPITVERHTLRARAR